MWGLQRFNQEWTASDLKQNESGNIHISESSTHTLNVMQLQMSNLASTSDEYLSWVQDIPKLIEFFGFSWNLLERSSGAPRHDNPVKEFGNTPHRRWWLVLCHVHCLCGRVNLKNRPVVLKCWNEQAVQANFFGTIDNSFLLKS